MNDEPPVLAQLLELGTRFAGRRALPNSRVYKDLSHGVDPIVREKFAVTG